MAYQPMDPGAQGILPLYLLISVIAIVMTINMWKKYSERGTKPVMYMLITFTVMALAVIMQVAGTLEMIITGYKQGVYKFALAFSYTGFMIANIAHLEFARTIFNMNKTTARIFMVICLISAVTLALPYNAYGLPENEIQYLNYRIFASGFLSIFSIIVYLRIALPAFKQSRQVKQPIAKAGFLWIGVSEICLILFFVLLTGDVLWFTFTESTGFSAFVWAAWIVAGMYFIISYMGLIMPDWLKKHYETIHEKVQKNDQKNKLDSI